MKKALLVMDMQEVVIGKNHADFLNYEDTLLKEINKVIDTYEKEDVIYIRNLMKRNLINKLAPFSAYEGSREAELAEDLHVVNDCIFDKYKGNAFTNSDLKRYIIENKYNEVEVIGVDGGGCVGYTALGACKEGLKVSIIGKAVGTMFEDKARKLNDKLTKLGVEFK